jgi:hypothetical protein
MEIVTEINEKVYKKLGIPKENLPEWYIRPNVLGIKNPKTFGR